MCEYNTKIEPIIVSTHDKGSNRGISIYFGLNELNKLEGQGIDLKKNQRFLVRTTLDNKLVLVPFSQLDFAPNIEEQLDGLIDLEKEEQDSLIEDLLIIITEKKIELDSTEQNAILQTTKGHHTLHNLRNIVRVGLRANKEATQALIKKYL